jgi:hypothetical protein
MKKINLLFLGVLLFALASCGSKDNSTDKTEESTDSTETTENQTEEEPMENEETSYVYELAINQAKDGQMETFLETRAKFVEELGKEEATLNEGKWKPFFTVAPDINLETILIGMTHWKSFEGFGASAQKLMPQEPAKNYFASFNPLAYVILETVDGKPFDLESIKKDGQVVEFAIRTAKEDGAFGEPRDAFFNLLNDYEGYGFAREFKVYELGEDNMPKLKENTQAVIITWENAEAFQKAAQPLFQTKEYAGFSSKVDASTYFATSPVK